MNDTDRKKDTLPEVFVSEEEAGEFWDTHSTMDYEEYLEPADLTFDIRKRHYLIEIDEDSFAALFRYSQEVNQPVHSVASTILKKQLISA